MQMKRFVVLICLSSLAACAPSHPTMSLVDSIKAKNSGQIKANLYWGCDVNAPDDDGESPLFLAARNGDVETTKLLLDAGANPMSEMKKGTWLGDRAIDVAFDEKIIRMYVEKSPSILNSDDGYRYDENGKVIRPSGRTPLHDAAYDAISLEKVKLLLELGANPNAKDGWGKTPLDMALQGKEEARVIARDYEGDHRNPGDWDGIIALLEKK